MIETLDGANRAETIEVFQAAFSQHPLLPPDPSGRKARLLVRSLLDAFAAAPDARLFGIRRDGRLDCAAFVYDDSYEPRGFTVILFLIRMVRVVGWKMTRTFAQVLAEKPGEKERRLELMIVGTRAECQGQGLGRAMIHHIFQFARDQRYQSVVLQAAKETPAFGFYLREGFQVEKEIALPAMPLCMLRRGLAEKPADRDAADKQNERGGSAP